MSYSNDSYIPLVLKVSVGEMRGLMSDLGIIPNSDNKDDDLLVSFLEVMKKILTSDEHHSLGEGLIYHSIEDIIEGGMGCYSKEDLIKEINKDYEQSKWTEERWLEYFKKERKKFGLG